MTETSNHSHNSNSGRELEVHPEGLWEAEILEFGDPRPSKTNRGMYIFNMKLQTDVNADMYGCSKTVWTTFAGSPQTVDFMLKFKDLLIGKKVKIKVSHIDHDYQTYIKVYVVERIL